MRRYSKTLRDLQTSWACNSRVLRIKNAKLSRHCFYINMNIQGDFQILLIKFGSTWICEIKEHTPQLTLLYCDRTVRSSHLSFSIKKSVHNISWIFHNIQKKHLCCSLFFKKLQIWKPAILLKRDPNTGVFLWIIRSF